MAYELIDESAHRRVRTLPDQEPVDMPWTPGVFADWITKEMVDTLIEEQP